MAVMWMDLMVMSIWLELATMTETNPRIHETLTSILDGLRGVKDNTSSLSLIFKQICPVLQLPGIGGSEKGEIFGPR